VNQDSLMARYWYQTCPACAKGRLFVERRFEDGRLFLECEECYTSWEAPEQLDRPGFSGVPVVSDYASVEEIRKAGWSKYPFHVALDSKWPGE
jgi:hypothetical protein